MRTSQADNNLKPSVMLQIISGHCHSWHTFDIMVHCSDSASHHQRFNSSPATFEPAHYHPIFCTAAPPPTVAASYESTARSCAQPRCDSTTVVSTEHLLPSCTLACNALHCLGVPTRAVGIAGPVLNLSTAANGIPTCKATITQRSLNHSELTVQY
jgi:hypothetical protein